MLHLNVLEYQYFSLYYIYIRKYLFSKKIMYNVTHYFIKVVYIFIYNMYVLEFK